ncbi:MAG TPA: rRNA maturation RNase YbeY [Bacteroidia bacterium]|nr:rRNA maturation RNase YbeY [Bacteroidia bacterium]
MANPIQFFVEEIDFKLPKPRALSAWLTNVAQGHGCTIEELNYIFVSDNYLLDLNKSFLQHDTLTDIITFPHTEEGSKELAADIYISVERVRENAISFGVTFPQELHRVMVHGLLHLVGFKDKDAKAKKEMRAAEDAAIALLEKK